MLRCNLLWRRSLTEMGAARIHKWSQCPHLFLAPRPSGTGIAPSLAQNDIDASSSSSSARGLEEGDPAVSTSTNSLDLVWEKNAIGTVEDETAKKRHLCEICEEVHVGLGKMQQVMNVCLDDIGKHERGQSHTTGGASPTPAAAGSSTFSTKDTLLETYLKGWNLTRTKWERSAAFPMQMHSLAARYLMKQVSKDRAGTMSQLVRVFGPTRRTRLVAHLERLHRAKIDEMVAVQEQVVATPVGIDKSKVNTTNAEAYQQQAEENKMDSQQQDSGIRADDGVSYEEALMGRWALRYAAAAFGVPYERHGFSSVENVATFQFSGDENMRFPVEKEQLLSLARMLHNPRRLEKRPLQKFIMGRLDIVAMKPTFFVVAEHDIKTIVISFRGTTSDGDIVTDLDAEPVPFFKGQTSRGFHATVRDSEASKELDELMATAMKQFPFYDVVVTGHSLGGAQAALYGTHLGLANVVPIKRLAIITFGAPPIASKELCDEIAASGLGDKMISFVNDTDCVPRLAVRNISRLLSTPTPKASATTEPSIATISAASPSKALELYVPGRPVLLHDYVFGAESKYALPVTETKVLHMTKEHNLLSVPIPSYRSMVDHLLPGYAKKLHRFILHHRMHDLHKGRYGEEIKDSLLTGKGESKQ